MSAMNVHKLYPIVNVCMVLLLSLCTFLLKLAECVHSLVDLDCQNAFIRSFHVSTRKKHGEVMRVVLPSSE